MKNYNDENLLEMVELYANENSLVASEDELSEQFDNDILPSILAAHGTPGDRVDEIMINEAFGQWADALCKSGEIHPAQYNEYCYVGGLS